LAMNRVTLSPLLLNEGDFITIKALVSEITDDPRVSARIAGVKAIENYTGRSSSPTKSLITTINTIGYASAVVASLSLLPLYYLGHLNARFLPQVMVAVFVVLGGLTSINVVSRAITKVLDTVFDKLYDRRFFNRL
jgi:hypothetical protein